MSLGAFLEPWVSDSLALLLPVFRFAGKQS